VAHTVGGDAGLADFMTAPVTSERGTTLIETMIAVAILLIAMAGLMGMSGLASRTTENNGHLAARTTEDAQDKMEQLLALRYGDSTSDTTDPTTFPANPAGGTGLLVGGSLNPAAPVAGYVDWLATDGTLLGGGTNAPNGWFYERVWQVTQFSTNVKLISVTVTTKWAFGKAVLPTSTVTALKGDGF
jgi:type II secretory pathway pseudopilin PulG